MKNRFRIILVLIVLLCVGCALYWRISPSSDAWHAADQLKNSTKFGFGPQGTTAQISDDEKRFFLILNSPKSHLVFRYLYDTGTPPAKAFAIVGLKQTLLGRADSRIDDFARSTTPFLTLSGCVGQDSTPKDLLSALDSFRQYIRHLNASKEAQPVHPSNP